MNEIALSLVLSTFTLIFLVVTATLWPMAQYAERYMANYLGAPEIKSLGTDIPTLVALLVCLIPTTIGALLAAIGIAGMDRALRANLIAKSGKAVEVAGDVDTLLLDKTGTITVGNRRATRFIPLDTLAATEVGHLAALASAADETPEGKSIVELHRRTPGAAPATPPPEARFISFTAQTRMSGVDLPDGRSIRKGSSDAVVKYVRAHGGTVPLLLDEQVNTVAGQGSTPLLIADGNKIVGLAVLEDILKPGIRERFERLGKMGIRTVMVTGDNPLTAKAIAEQAGVDDYIAEATPEAKLAYIRKEQAGGRLVAMMGDGTNDAPALAQADLGVAMNSGTQAAKEAGNMVDLDSDPTKLIECVEIGKQLLMTRGALTTFSIANDVAKYFAIVPALFTATLPWLKKLDFMHLASPTSAIMSAVIFNAIIIPLLIPVALKGVTYRPVGADALLRRNLLIWGLGGVIAPFVWESSSSTWRWQQVGPCVINGPATVVAGITEISHETPSHESVASGADIGHLRPGGCVPAGAVGVWAGCLPDEGQRQPDEPEERGRHRANCCSSRLIAQKLTGDEYFYWPRPSAADATTRRGRRPLGRTSGANNPKLRDRAAQQLGPIVVYKKGSASAGPNPNKPRTPQEDIEKWFAEKPDRAADWAGEYSVAAVNWAKTDFAKDKYGLQGEYIIAWTKSHKEVMEEWKKANPTKTDEPKPEDLVSLFFTSFAKVHPRKWPAVRTPKTGDKTIEPTTIEQMSKDEELSGNLATIDGNFFEMWLQDPANRAKVADLEPVPADMVTASGAGLDPHITLRNALCIYQLDRVAAKRAVPSARTLNPLVRKHSFTPLSGLVGEPLVNVLELNLELDTNRFPVPPKSP